MPDDSHRSDVAPADAVVVILGASNVTLAWPRIVDLVYGRFQGCVSLYNAHGMGRSYLYKRSSFGIRQLPGILHCQLWENLPQVRSATQTYALITDLGNDLLYGSDADRVAWSASECVRRLREWSPDVQIVVSQPPVASVESLGKVRFYMASRVLFPMTNIRLEETKQQTVRLAESIVSQAETEGYDTFLPNGEWYGVDPIHVRRRFQADAFSGMMAPWEIRSAGDTRAEIEMGPRATKAPRATRKRPTARFRWIMRKEIETAQPVAGNEGLTVYTY